MKTKHLWKTPRALAGVTCAVLALGGAALAQPTGQPPLPTNFNPVGRTAFSRTWERVTARTNAPKNIVILQTNRVVELCSGLSRPSNGQWVDTDTSISLQNDGAAATNGAHQSYFDGNLNAAPVRIVMPNGGTLKVKPAFVCYYDFHQRKVSLVADL